MQELLRLLGQSVAAREPCAVATVIEIRGSASARPGSKALIDRHGKVVCGWVGGGCAQSTVCQTALDCLQSGRTQIVDLNLDDEVLGTGMPCGGSMRVFVEPVLPRPVLWLLGHGAIAEALCRMGAELGLQIYVDDPLAERERYPAAARLMPDDLDYSQLTPAAEDYVVIATQHKGDHQSMLRVVGSPCRYIALIASAKRAGLVLDFLRDEGIDGTALAKVHAPAGLDLGAATPEEIALSVLSEIVMCRRGGTGALKRLDAADRAPAGAANMRPPLAVVRG